MGTGGAFGGAGHVVDSQLMLSASMLGELLDLLALARLIASLLERLGRHDRARALVEDECAEIEQASRALSGGKPEELSDARIDIAGPGQRLGECPRTRGQVRLEEGPAEAIRLKGLDSVATAYGTTDNAAREAMYEQLKRKGVMPAHEQG